MEVTAEAGVLEPLELELPGVVTSQRWVLGTKLRPSAKAARTLKH